jgi:hypothetical protein
MYDTAVSLPLFSLCLNALLGYYIETLSRHPENPNLDSVSEPWVFGLNLQNEAVVITMARRCKCYGIWVCANQNIIAFRQHIRHSEYSVIVWILKLINLAKTAHANK